MPCIPVALGAVTKERAAITHGVYWQAMPLVPIFHQAVQGGDDGRATDLAWTSAAGSGECPVSLHSVLRASSNLHFHFINPKTGNRVRMVTLDAETDKEVPGAIW